MAGAGLINARHSSWQQQATKTLRTSTRYLVAHGGGDHGDGIAAPVRRAINLAPATQTGSCQYVLAQGGAVAHGSGVWFETRRHAFLCVPVDPRRCRTASHPPSAARVCIRSPGERYSPGIEVICPIPCIPPAADEKCTGEIGAKLPYLLLRICLACRSCF